jgi:uncharacterized protein (TIGR03437 family)
MKANPRLQGHPFFEFLAVLTFSLAFAIAYSFLPQFISPQSVKAQQAVTLVNAASFASDNILAPDTIGAAFGNFSTLNNTTYSAATIPLPTTLGGVSVAINGQPAGLGFVGPTQINLVVPSGVADGPATIIVTDQSGSTKSGTFTVVRSRPGIFTATTSPNSAPAALFTIDGVSYDSVSNPNGTPKDLNAGTQQQPTYLILYVTGLRNTPAANPGDGNGVAESVKVTFQGVEGIVEYAGIAPGYVGLDQINVRIPWALSGLGNISVKVFASNGQGGFTESNQVTIRLGGQAPDIVATPITPGQVVNGALTNQDYVQDDGLNFFFFDAYSFQTNGPNASVAIDLRSNDFDAAVLLYRLQGNMLIPVAADDYTGAIGGPADGPDHALLFVVLPEQATYVVLATTALSDPLGIGTYRLLLTANAVTTIQYGANLNANITSTDVQNGANTYFDAYSFTGQQGDSVRITMTTTAPMLGPFLLLNRNNGSFVDVDENDQVLPTAMIETTLPQSGLYTILATLYDPTVTGPYTLSLQRLSGGVAANAPARSREPVSSWRRLPSKALRIDAESPLTRESFFESMSRRRFVK